MCVCARVCVWHCLKYIGPFWAYLFHKCIAQSTSAYVQKVFEFTICLEGTLDRNVHKTDIIYLRCENFDRCRSVSRGHFYTSVTWSCSEGTVPVGSYGTSTTDLNISDNRPSQMSHFETRALGPYLVYTMAIGALALCVAAPSAAMVLPTHGKYVLVFYVDGFNHLCHLSAEKL